ncbi:hypothetical protein AaE_014489 [Aphanomyces astaci]|uniref:protein O-GlcNAc transferase n=1 Tax=Aphanomyces astaci TaxID=112090 RepID=A0A6A4Z180_APHAT|nr:hypothetical protein AaE_014489 [Aphanomyces astaci]
MQAGDTARAEQLLLRLSMVAPDDVDVHVALGAMNNLEGNVDIATKYYNSVLTLDPTNDAVHGNLAFLNFKAGQYARAIDHFKASVATNPTKAQGMAHMIALAHHAMGDEVTAITFFDLAQPLHDNDPHFHFDFAVSLQDEGLVTRANAEYNRALALDPNFPEVAFVNSTLSFTIMLINRLGLILPHCTYATAAYQQHFEILMWAHWHFDNTVLIVCVVASPSTTAWRWKQTAMYVNYNIVVVGVHIGMMSMAIYDTTWQAMEALVQFETAQTLLEWMDHSDREALDLFEHKTRTRRAIVSWVEYEETWDAYLDATITRQLNRQEVALSCHFPMVQTDAASSLVPFSSLMVDIPPHLRRRIAEAYAGATTPIRPPQSVDLNKNNRRVHVGYLSHDFNNHPTAHLMEGLFVHHDTLSFEISTWSYGKDDGSAYRKSIPTLSEHFMDVVLLGTNEAAAAIEAARVDILVDAQGHTLGDIWQRHAIVAKQPAAIIVNFLVYPGTLGAAYVDYMVSDRHVTPAEHAGRSCGVDAIVIMNQYTEHLMVLPQSYQVNYYASYYQFSVQERHATAMTSSTSFVFANFNKLDKVEPRDDICARRYESICHVPHSELWLLHPTSSNTHDLIVANLVREAAQHGVAAARLRFLPRYTHSF